MSQAPAPAAAAPADAPPKAGKTSKVVLVLVALNLVAVAGVGGYVALQMQKQPPAAGAHAAAPGGHGEEPAHGEAPAGGAHEEEEGDGEEEDEEEEGHGARPIIALEAIITNFVDAEETHFLKVTVQLEAKNEASKVKIEEALVPIRDLVLLRLSSLTLEETRGADKKRALQAELRTMINAELHSRRVKHVYFTEFVVQ